MTKKVTSNCARCVYVYLILEPTNETRNRLILAVPTAQ